jgi:hypothetical protein
MGTISYYIGYVEKIEIVRDVLCVEGKDVDY